MPGEGWILQINKTRFQHYSTLCVAVLAISPIGFLKSGS